MVSRYVVLLLALFISACSSETKDTTKTKEVDLVEAETIFRSMCAICHGDDGKLGLAGAKDLSTTTLGLNEMKAVIKYGKGQMTPFVDRLSDEEIELVAFYIDKFKP